MRKMKPDKIAAVVTDPPYGLEFMGKEWDSFGKPKGFDKRTRENSGAVKDAYARTFDRAPNHYVAGAPFQDWCTEWATELLRITLPGAHVLAFGGTRTYHHLACGLERAGFEIRDCLMWLYGSGFPKSLDVGKTLEDWQGWGTALKPAWEPIVLARKPFTGTVASNVLRHSTGALNIDATRIAGPKPKLQSIDSAKRNRPILHTKRETPRLSLSLEGRWPANVILTHSEACGEQVIVGLFGELSEWICTDDCPVDILDAQSGIQKDGKAGKRNAGVGLFDPGSHDEWGTYGSGGGASRFFYTAKAAQTERHAGGRVENKHPTVKPVDLMRWLIRLVTPPNGVVLDPFAGSGSTLVAAWKENRSFIGIEKDADSAHTALERLGGKADLV